MGWKSDKDREAFISKMQEAGFTQEDIDDEVAAIDQQKTAPAAAPPPALKPSSQAGGGGSPMTQPATAAPSISAAPAQSVQADLSSMNQARQEQGNSLTDQVFNVENAQLLGIPLAVYGGYKLADKALEKSGLKARIFGQPSPIDRTVDIPLEATPDNKLPQAAQQPKLSTQEQQMLERSEINRLAKERDAAARALAAGPTPIPEPPAFIRNPAPAGSVAPVASVPSPVVPATAPTQAPAVVPTTAIEPAPVLQTAPAPVVETPKSVAEEVKQDVKNVQQAASEVVQETKPKKAKAVQPPNTGGADNWLHSMAGKDLYMEVIRTQNEGKPYGPGEEAQTKAYSDWKKYQNQIGRMRPYTKTPVLNLETLESQKFKSANIPGKIPFSAVPPPSLRPAPQLGGGGGGSLIRGMTDPLQLKQ